MACTGSIYEKLSVTPSLACNQARIHTYICTQQLIKLVAKTETAWKADCAESVTWLHWRHLLHTHTYKHIHVNDCRWLFRVISRSQHRLPQCNKCQSPHTENLNDCSTVARALWRLVSRAAPVCGILSGRLWRCWLVGSEGRRCTCVVAMSHICRLHLFAHLCTQYMHISRSVCRVPRKQRRFNSTGTRHNWWLHQWVKRRMVGNYDRNTLNRVRICGS